MTRNVIGLFSLVFAAWAYAQGLGPPAWDVPQGRWWERPGAAEKIGLTPEQRNKLEQISSHHLKNMVDARAAVQKAEMELRFILNKEPFDPREVREAFAAVQQARKSLESERFELLLAERQVLSPDQWQKLKAFAKERAAERRDGRRRFNRPGQPPAAPGPQRF